MRRTTFCNISEWNAWELPGIIWSHLEITTFLLCMSVCALEMPDQDNTLLSEWSKMKRFPEEIGWQLEGYGRSKGVSSKNSTRPFHYLRSGAKVTATFASWAHGPLWGSRYTRWEKDVMPTHTKLQKETTPSYSEWPARIGHQLVVW